VGSCALGCDVGRGLVAFGFGLSGGWGEGGLGLGVGGGEGVKIFYSVGCLAMWAVENAASKCS